MNLFSMLEEKTQIMIQSTYFTLDMIYILIEPVGLNQILY